MKFYLGIFIESILFFMFLLMAESSVEILKLKCIFTGKIYSVPFACTVFAAWLLGMLGMFILQSMVFKNIESKKLADYKKQYEKNSVSQEEKDSQIKALENKVKTLEAALDNMIKKGNQ
ncbi:MAG: hypothetical protein ACI37T_07185 [Candidatus Gastranaerophilaceae bacterium]